MNTIHTGNAVIYGGVGEGEIVGIFDINGRIVCRFVSSGKSDRNTVAAGLYIVKAGGIVAKTIAR